MGNLIENLFSKSTIQYGTRAQEKREQAAGPNPGSIWQSKEARGGDKLEQLQNNGQRKEIQELVRPQDTLQRGEVGCSAQPADGGFVGRRQMLALMQG